ncbi:MAG: ornithine carbamoyltransferase [Pirellulaceae bacterium]|nr:ornithine carbamoyltransferase [Pirellulaceae bacterium]
MRHFISLLDITQPELQTILNLGLQVKSLLQRGVRPVWLPQRVLAMIFEKPSLRTRVSFEAGIAQLGGLGMYLGKDVGWPDRESAADFIRVLAEYVDFVVCRLRSHAAVVELASFDCVPIINGLTDQDHPCQALGDLMTIYESSSTVAGKSLTFIGDGNNVSQSLARACAMVGIRFRLLGPSDYFLQPSVVQQITQHYPAADIVQTEDSALALTDADFVYTDVWTSMGQEAESAERIAAFSPFQLNARLMAKARPDCKILHCLPARRGQEITDEVIDSPNSLVVRQAGNRMHAQKGLLLWLALQHGQVAAAELQQSGIQL